MAPPMKKQHFVADVSLADKRRLQAFMVAERNLYNKINDELVRLLHRNPTVLAGITDPVIDTIATIIAHNIPIRDVRKQVKHDALKDQMAFLPMINETMLVVLENIMVIQHNIHHVIKHGMMREFLSFYANSAKIAVKGNETHAFLEPLDDMRKRHVQLRRDSGVIAKFDKTSGNSVIQTVYSQNPVIIKGIDVTKEPWNHIVIHQRPGKMPNASDPWMVELLNSSSKYQLQYMEHSNPYGNRNISANAGRCVVF